MIAAATGCGGGADITEPGVGTLEITSTTTGPQTDVDGYSVQLDAEPARSIGVASTLRSTEVRPGPHTVLLGGVAVNCTIEGDNPRAVNVTAGQTATITFAVSCSPTTGSLQVSSSTSGPSPDPDGYIVTIDGTDRGPLGVNSDITHDRLIPGTHLVGLSAVAGNCRVQGENPRSISVTAGETASGGFVVVCVAPPSNSGTLRITTTTTGPSPDPDGYAFSVDGGGTQPIAANTVTTVSSLAVGAHMVELLNVEANCVVQGTKLRAVTIVAGTTADVNFEVACAATFGSIAVITTSLGPTADPDGYTVVLDGLEQGPIGVSATINLTGVTPGARQVGLSGLALGCLAQGENPQSIIVEAGITATARFSIGCVITTGTVEVTTVTTGSQLDPDGFLISLDDGVGQVIGVNTTLTFPAVAPGAHTVKLAGLAVNCVVQISDVKPVSVIAGNKSTVSFAVRCPPPVTGYVAIDLGTLGGSSSRAFEINAAGQVVGMSDFESDTHAFLWEKGVMTDLGTLNGGDFSVAVDINTSGQVVGSSAQSQVYSAFLWENSLMADLSPLAQASGINEGGQVVGVSWVPGVPLRNHAFLWANGTLTDLGTLGGLNSLASAINSAGQVVGNSDVGNGESHAFLWANGVMTDLGTLGGGFSEASDVNTSGEVVGMSLLPNRENRAVLWAGGVIKDLGTLGGANSLAYDINVAGKVVGSSETSYGESHAFLWENGVMKDLGTLGGGYSDAQGINHDGQIVGSSSTPTGESHATLWVPN
jgi:probable HAF family extracellular repeat protein